MPKPDFPEFIAATLPPAQQWKGRMVWRPDLSVHQVSDGSTWSTVGSSVSGAGKLARPKIDFAGDSLTNYGSARQTIAMSTSVTPYGGTAFSIIGLSWANGSGTSGTLTFSKSAQTLRWAAPGEAAGAAVGVSRAGVYTISGVTATKTITIVCRPRLYSAATEGDFTVTTTASTEAGRRSGKAYPFWAHAKARAAFDVSTLGNGGSIISDITESIGWQVPAGYYNAIVLLAGTNDIAADRTLAQIKTDLAALIVAAKAKAPRVFILTLLPRSAGMSTARRQIMAAANKWIMSLVDPAVTPVNAFGRLLDPASATGDPLTGMLEDGLHTTIAGAEAVGDAVYQAIADAFTFDASPVVSSQADTYDATNNPQGNQLPAGGTFSGTGGTAGTGVTGTIAASWSVTRDSGANITVVGSQIARSDGLPGLMQRLVISNPGAGVESVLIAPINAARPAIAVGQVWRTQGSALLSSMTGMESITLAIEPAGTSGAYAASWGQNGISGAALTGARNKLVMEPDPCEIVAGAVLNIALRVRLAAGGACTLDLLPGEWALWRES